MKISKARLKQIIKEELQREYRLNEGIMDSIKGMFGGNQDDGVHPRVKDWEAENLEDALNAKDIDTVDAAMGSLQRICRIVDGGQNAINYPDTAIKCKAMNGELHSKLQDFEYDQNVQRNKDEKNKAQADHEYEQSQREPARIPDRCRGLQGRGDERALAKCIKQEREEQRKNRGGQEDDEHRVHNTDSGWSAPWAE